MSVLERDLLAITPDDLERFNTEGYLHLKGIVPEEQLVQVQRPLEAWVERMVQKWIAEGLLDEAFESLPFEKRLYEAWFAAGKPVYERSPRVQIVSPEVFDFLREPVFVDLARDLIGADTLAAHGIFNSRPKLGQQLFTDTPWHQDAQYFRKCAGNDIITMWIPLVDVDETNSCLQVAPGHHIDPLYANFSDKSGFIGLTPEDKASLKGKPIIMKRGDLLCFNEMMPHAALHNNTETVRWSMDIRFEELGRTDSMALDQGFVCAHPDASQIETSYDNWVKEKWQGKSVY